MSFKNTIVNSDIISLPDFLNSKIKTKRKCPFFQGFETLSTFHVVYVFKYIDLKINSILIFSVNFMLFLFFQPETMVLLT